MATLLKNVYTCFPDGKHKVLTMSYDDGQIFDRRLVAIFNKNGIKGTFNINSGLIDGRDEKVRPEEFKELYAGHEVAVHTYTHPTIARCPISQVVQQVILDRQLLEDVMGYPVRGMAYPNGSYSKEIEAALPSCGVEYSRVVGGTQGFGFPQNYYEWQATCHHNKNLMKLAEEFASLKKRQYLYMMYVWGHSYEFDHANNWELIEGFCEFIGNRDDVWYATNIEIVDYMNAAHNLKYTARCDRVYNPSAIPVWIEVDGKHIKVDGGQTLDI